MSRPRRWPADTRPLQWDNREDFGRQRAEWLERVRRDADLLAAAKVVLAEIGARFSHDKSHAWPSFPRLAADIATSPKTVQRAVVDGMRRGWLLIERAGFGCSNRYSLATSPLVVEQVEAAHGDRLSLLVEPRPFRSPVSRLDDGPIQVIGDLSLRTPVTSHSGHPRPLIQVTGVHLIVPKNPIREPDQETPTDPLGETEQDEALQQPEISLSDLHRALGEGDIDLGQHRAARLGRSRIEFLRSQVAELGLRRAAHQIRDAASDADQAELAAPSGHGRNSA